MQFNSYTYVISLVCAVLLFWQLPARARRWLVLVASLAFYATWSIRLVALPIGISAITYVCALRVARDPRARKWALGLGIGAVLCILGFFKYSDFALELVRGVIPHSLGWPLGPLHLALPLGISFYSFEAISYLLDVRQGRVKEIRFLDLTLFVLFWPHLMAGPIVRVRELIPQLEFRKRFETALLWQGADRIFLGLVQKNLFANSVAGWIDDGFLPKVAAANSTIDVWALGVAFGLQVYFDFAAYSNIAIGTAKLLGVTLPENFNHPYWAATPPDFWARWHMTLSRWVRDYLFFPINAKHQGSPLVLYASLVGVMGLVGLWHGAGWGFVVWGLLHGVYLVAFRAFEAWRAGRWPDGGRALATRWGWRVATLIGVVVAWIPFRASSLGQCWTLLRTMLFRFDLRISYSVNFYLVVALLSLYCLAEPHLRNKILRLEQRSNQRRLTDWVYWIGLKPVLYSIALLFFLAFDDQDTAFIYFQF